MKKPKIMFLFGAGASHGNCSISSHNPPLGNGLYAALLESSEIWRLHSDSFNDELKSDFHRNFELAFTKINRPPFIKDELQRNAMILNLQIEIMKYLISFNPHSELELNNYYKLIKTLKNNALLFSTSFSSLNYDCILEKILTLEKISYCDYLGNSDETYEHPIKLYKPHGSSNYTLRQSNFHVEGTAFSPTVKLNLPIDVLKFQTPYETDNRNQRGLLWPIMSLYTSDKENINGKTSLANIRKKWAYEVHKATHIISIGVRYVENDTHIWDPIKNSKGKIIFYGENSSLNSFIRKKNVFIREEYFDKSCESFIEYI